MSLRHASVFVRFHPMGRAVRPSWVTRTVGQNGKEPNPIKLSFQYGYICVMTRISFARAVK